MGDTASPGRLRAIPGPAGRAAWPLNCLCVKPSRSIRHQCESPAQVPLRSSFSLHERQLMALAQCCLLHCPVPHVNATFVSGGIFQVREQEAKFDQRRCTNKRTVSETKLTPNLLETLLSFLSQLPVTVQRNRFLFHFELQILILTHKAARSCYFPNALLSGHLPVPPILLWSDSLEKGNKRVEGVPVWSFPILYPPAEIVTDP